MSFISIAAYNASNTSDLLDKLYTELTGAGWVDHDDQRSGSSYFVVTTQGESDRCPTKCYLRISANGMTDQIEFMRFGYWDNSGHSGTFQIGSTQGRASTDDDAAFYVWIYGNKDGLILITKVGATYDGISCLRFRPVVTALGRLQSSISTGTTVVVTVDKGQTDRFCVGMGVTLFDAQNGSHAGRDHRSVITAIDKPNNQITLDQVYLAMQAGALIGAVCDFWITWYMTGKTFYNFNTETTTSTGTSTSTATATMDHLFDYQNLDPEQQASGAGPTGLYWGQPFALDRSSYGVLGVLDRLVYNCHYSGATEYNSYENTASAGEQQSERQGTGGGNDYLDDSGESWDTDEWAGKVIIITQGTGAGQIRLISSNTATRITVANNWSTNPDATSYYVICDRGLRLWGFGSGANCFFTQDQPAAIAYSEYMITTTTTTTTTTTSSSSTTTTTTA